MSVIKFLFVDRKFVLYNKAFHIVDSFCIFGFWCVSEFKRARSELKKKNTDTLRLRKKVKRASAGVGPGGGLGGMGGAELAQKCLSNALQGMHDDYILLEENQRQAVRRALIEQRRRYCAFVHCIKPVMVSIRLTCLLLITQNEVLLLLSTSLFVLTTIY